MKNEDLVHFQGPKELTFGTGNWELMRGPRRQRHGNKGVISTRDVTVYCCSTPSRAPAGLENCQNAWHSLHVHVRTFQNAAILCTVPQHCCERSRETKRRMGDMDSDDDLLIESHMEALLGQERLMSAETLGLKTWLRGVLGRMLAVTEERLGRQSLPNGGNRQVSSSLHAMRCDGHSLGTTGLWGGCAPWALALGALGRRGPTPSPDIPSRERLFVCHCLLSCLFKKGIQVCTSSRLK